MTQLQVLVLSTLGGAPVMQPSVGACSSSISSALTLILFIYTVHGLVFACSVFFSLEQRLKADWVKRHTGQQLLVQSWSSCLLQKPLGAAAKSLTTVWPNGYLRKMCSLLNAQQTLNSSSSSGNSVWGSNITRWLLLPLVLSVVWLLSLWAAELPAMQHAAHWCERDGIKVTPPCGK
jgi:hypothetical protein